ncbi:cysteine protease [Cryptosporidium sp. chipmunk genotype I]|uniref:cysteine protease n=1 Tax=Cryptosporidium sp. chipmunk genotype I TaxID=1280935 RepID=UPI00351A9799|nr:cysteine protease [Cryptosporidium sp. chipmunk genotype I]
MKEECLLPSEVRVKNIEGDGNCLFRSVGSQIYGESDYHDIIRSACMDYVDLNKESFSGFVHEYPSIEKYIQEKRKLGVWADNIELQALSDLYRIPIYVFEKVRNTKLNASLLEKLRLDGSSGAASDKIFYENKEFVYKLLCKIEPRHSNVLDQIKKYYSNSRPIRLLYHNDLHYDSLFYRREHQTPIINMQIGVIETKSIKSLKIYKTLTKQEVKSKNFPLEDSNLKTDRINHFNNTSCALLRKKAIKQFSINFGSSSESDNYTAKSPFFLSVKNRYRDEPDSVFEGNCLDKISDGEAHFERLYLKSKQLYSKFISGPKSFPERPIIKPAYFSKIKSLNNTHLGVVDRYARDVQLSSHQKELKKLLTGDSPRPSSIQSPGKKCVAIYCPAQNFKQKTFRN